MLRIAIVDDQEAERRQLLACIRYLEAQEGLEIDVKEFDSGALLIGNYQPVYDIIFMDIEMPGIDGMETARALRRMDTAVILIFVTNYIQYAINGYEVDAMNYLLKPVNRYDFSMKMRKAIARTTKCSDTAVTLKTERELHKVRVISIQYLEVLGHYVTYHTTEGDFSEYITLKEAEQKLGQSFFVRCGRPYLVNLKYVSGIRNGCALVGGVELPISRAYRKSFLQAFSEFMGGVNG